MAWLLRLRLLNRNVHLGNEITSCMQQKNPYWEPGSYSVTQVILELVWNPKAFCVHVIKKMSTILSHNIPVHIFVPCFSNITYDILSHLCLCHLLLWSSQKTVARFRTYIMFCHVLCCGDELLSPCLTPCWSTALCQLYVTAHLTFTNTLRFRKLPLPSAIWEYAIL